MEKVTSLSGDHLITRLTGKSRASIRMRVVGLQQDRVAIWVPGGHELIFEKEEVLEIAAALIETATKCA